MLATADSAGRPHLVPVTYVALNEHVYIAVDAKPKRSSDLKRIRNIRANPLVSMLVDHYSSDWEKLWWVRADGSATITDFSRLPEGLLGAFQQRYPWYLEHPPDGPVIDVAVTTWTGWSFTGDG